MGRGVNQRQKSPNFNVGILTTQGGPIILNVLILLSSTSSVLNKVGFPDLKSIIGANFFFKIVLIFSKLEL